MKKNILIVFLVTFQMFAVVAQNIKKEVKDIEVSNTKAVFLGTSSPKTTKKFKATTRIKKVKAKEKGELPPNFIGRGRSKVTNPSLEHQGPDPIRQSGFSRKSNNIIIPSVNIDGLSNSFGSPHDPTGSIGAEHYVQAINATTIGVFDKAGNLISSFVANTLWSPLGETSLGDPIILYDHEFDRWIITEFAQPALLLIAVSKTGDPLGDYNVYSFATPQFPDYPKYSIWSDHIVVTTNESGPGFLHQYFLDRMALINGEEDVSIQRVQINGNSNTEAGFYVTTPVHWDGVLAPEDNKPLAVKINDSSWGQVSEDMIEVYSFDVDFEDPTNTVVNRLEIVSTPFDSYPCDNESGGFACLSQGEGNGGIDAIPEVIMNVPHYRNFGSHESIVFNFITDVTDGNDLSGIRWVELRKTPGNDWSLHQEGTFAPDDGLHRYMGSIAMDELGNIGLAYTVSGPTTFAGIRFTGRYADDPPGEMTVQETSIVDGLNGIFTDRFGDYPHMTVDPVDGQTFWFTSEYAGNGTNNSLTRIIAFQLEKKDNDLAVTEISQPETSATLGDSESVVATVENLGNLDVASYDISLYLDEVLIETFNQSTPLVAGESYEHTFSNTIDVSGLGEYDIRVDVSFIDDQSSGNDSKRKRIKKLAFVDAAISLDVTDETCVGEASGQVTITNEGADNLTIAEIELFRGTESERLLTWTGNLETGQSDEFNVTYTELVDGVNEVSAVINSVNEVVDEVSDNDVAISQVDVSNNLKLVTLELRTDNFPGETVWSLEDGEGEILFQGGPYSSQLTTFTDEFCLPKDQCYIFRIFDAASDGICCDFGQGSYTLSDSDGVIFEGNGQFGFTEETLICVGDAPQVDVTVSIDEPGNVCANDVVSQFQLTNIGEQVLTSLEIDINVNGELQETFDWEGELSFNQSEFILVNYAGLAEGVNDISIDAKNPNGIIDENRLDNVSSTSITVAGVSEEENLTFILDFDDFPEETTWQLATDADEILYSGGPYEVIDGQVVETLCVPKDQCYVITVFDSEGDGLCCGFGEGSFQILNDDGNSILASDGVFGALDAESFCLGDACNLTFEVAVTDVVGDQGGTIMITASGGVGFEYSINGGLDFQSSNVFNDLISGDYDIAVRDENGCVAADVVTLTVDCQLSISVNSNPTGNNVGIIEIEGQGGLKYEYSIDGGVTYRSSGIFSNVPSGEYNISVRSNEGNCLQEQTIVVDFVLGTSVIKDEILITPNPNNGVFDVSLTGFESIEGFLELQIFDINGRLIQERKLSRYDDTFEGRISLYAYPNGVYLLKPKNTGSNQMIKIIKQ